MSGALPQAGPVVASDNPQEEEETNELDSSFPQAGPVVALEDLREETNEQDLLYDYGEEADEFMDDEEHEEVDEEQEAEEILFLSISDQLDARPDVLERYLVSTPTRFFKFLDNHQPLLRQYIKTKSRKQAEKKKLAATTQPSAAEQIEPPSSALIAPTLSTTGALNPRINTNYVPPTVDQAFEVARTVDGDGSYPYPPRRITTSLRFPAGEEMPWREYEQDACIRHMLDVRNSRRFTGEARFDEAARRLQDEGINRSNGAVKNFWNRKGRLRSGFDERKRQNEVLATSQQPAKKRKADAYCLDQPSPERRNKRRSQGFHTPSVDPQMRQPQQRHPQQQYRPQQQFSPHQLYEQQQQQHSQPFQFQYPPRQTSEHMPPQAMIPGQGIAGPQMPADAIPMNPARSEHDGQQGTGSDLPGNYQGPEGTWNWFD